MMKTAIATLLLLGLLAPADEPSEVTATAVGGAEARAVERVEAHLLAARHTARLAPEARAELAHVLVRDALANDLEPSMVLAVIQVESTFNPRALSSASAYGLMQIRPRTGLAYARMLGIDWRGPEQTLFDPVENVRIGILYLARLRDRFGSIPTALSAYNQGPTRVSRRLRARQAVPAGYAQRVMNAWAGNLVAVGS
jgi:soluble lytic murein transglycosylase